MQEKTEIENLEKIGQPIMISYDKNFNIKEESEKKETVLFIKFDAENQKCLVMIKKYNIDTEMVYREGDELMIVAKAMNLINTSKEKIQPKVKTKKIKTTWDTRDMNKKANVNMFVFMLVILIIMMLLAIFELFAENYLVASNILAMAATIALITVNKFITDISKTIIGVSEIVTGWTFFLNHSFIFGIIYVMFGGIDMYKDF